MDLNYLYKRQQISLFNADNAACVRSRRAHQSMANAYAALISVAKNKVRPRAWPAASRNIVAAKRGSSK